MKIDKNRSFFIFELQNTLELLWLNCSYRIINSKLEFLFETCSIGTVLLEL